VLSPIEIIYLARFTDNALSNLVNWVDKFKKKEIKPDYPSGWKRKILPEFLLQQGFFNNNQLGSAV
jgi:hypothetical protein